jgi:LysM repeat protein
MPHRIVALLFLIFAVAAGAAEPPVEFSGVIVSEGKTTVALTDKTKQATDWVAVGGDFGDYHVASYNPQEQTVILKKDGAEYPLVLVSGKTGAAPAAPAAPVAGSGATDPAAAAVLANLRRLAAAAHQFELEHGGSSATYADLVGPGKLINDLRPVDGENYAALTFGGASPPTVTTAHGLTVSLETSAVPLQAAAVPNPAVAATILPAPPAADNASTAPAPAAPAAPLAPTGSTYTVQPGDSLAKIAATAGLSVERLQALNPGVNPTALQPGQPVRIR